MVVKQMLAQGESVDVSDRIVTRPPEPIVPVVPVAPSRSARPVAELTPRQLQILTMIAQGQSTKEIAWSLDLSVKTIETHRLQLMQRIGIRDVAGLTLYAVKNQLVAA
jgi:DNA-binding NarL/FixJ family response regulator